MRHLFHYVKSYCFVKLLGTQVVSFLRRPIFGCVSVNRVNVVIVQTQKGPKLGRLYCSSTFCELDIGEYDR
jgi:hypothetical protein